MCLYGNFAFCTYSTRVVIVIVTVTCSTTSTRNLILYFKLSCICKSYLKSMFYSADTTKIILGVHFRFNYYTFITNYTFNWNMILSLKNIKTPCRQRIYVYTSLFEVNISTLISYNSYNIWLHTYSSKAMSKCRIIYFHCHYIHVIRTRC